MDLAAPFIQRAEGQLWVMFEQVQNLFGQGMPAPSTAPSAVETAATAQTATMPVELWMYLALGLFMFSCGVVGVVMRRNPIVIFMCIELMLNSANLTFLAFARYMPSLNVTMADRGFEQAWMGGQMMVIFVMAVAAAEVAVGLGIIMAIFRLRNEIDIDELNLLRG